MLAHHDGRHLDRPPSLSGHCGHGPIFIAQGSVANDPIRTFAPAASRLFDHPVGADKFRRIAPSGMPPAPHQGAAALATAGALPCTSVPSSFTRPAEASGRRVGAWRPPIPARSGPVREARGVLERLGAATALIACCLTPFGSFQEPESDAAGPGMRGRRAEPPLQILGSQLSRDWD